MYLQYVVSYFGTVSSYAVVSCKLKSIMRPECTGANSYEFECFLSIGAVCTKLCDCQQLGITSLFFNYQIASI